MFSRPRRTRLPSGPLRPSLRSTQLRSTKQRSVNLGLATAFTCFIHVACSSGGAHPAEGSFSPDTPPGVGPQTPTGADDLQPVTPGVPGSAPPSTTTTPFPTQVDAVGLRTTQIQRSKAQVLSRLTNTQYLNSSAALLGLDAADFANLLPAVTPNGGYSNAGYAQSQPYDLIAGFDAVAKAMAEAIPNVSELTSRYGGCTEPACLPTFIAAFGERAFRRPLTAQEVSAFDPILVASNEQGLDFDDTVRLLVRAVLQAPEFLYLFESASLDDFQLASRLSFYVTDGPPDDALYADAKAGALQDPAKLAAHVDRLLAVHGGNFARAFAYDYFNLRKAYQRTVNVDAATVGHLVDSLTATFADLIERDAPISELLTTRTFVVNPETATYLGQPSANGTLTAPPTNGFMGLLTHPAALIAISNAYEGSMVSRGLFLAHQLLCIPPTPPPARAFSPDDVSGELPPNPTQRDEAEARLADTNCLGCHIQFEPYAFALNHWGGDGLYNTSERLRDNGPIRTSLGELAFTTYEDFFPLLAKSAQFQRCTADHLIRYGIRHSNYDDSVVDAVLASVGSGSEPTFRQLIGAVIQQPLFTGR
jgi:hypothetical protein